MCLVDETLLLTSDEPLVLINAEEITRNTSNTLILVLGFSTVELSIPAGDEIIIGRQHTSNRVQPQLDLGKYDATALGMSRIHASIRHENNVWWIKDLGSSNGTWLNNQRLAPFISYRLDDISQVWFAKLEVQLILPVTSPLL